MVSVTDEVGGTRVRRVTAAVGSESAERPGRGSGWEYPMGASRLGVSGGEWTTLASSPTGTGEARGPGDAT